MYGDIHGCLEELQNLRKLLDIQKGDREISVGDFVGKGPYSVEVLRYMQKEGIEAVRGNHEDKFLRYYLHQQRGKNPMRLDKKEQEIYHTLQRSDFAFLFSLPLFIQIDRLTIVHAGVLPSTNLFALNKKEAAKVMRVRFVDEEGRFVVLDRSDIRRHFWWSELYDGRFGYIVYGHQPFLTPRIDRFSFGIDTGAVYGNRLSAIVFERKSHIDIESWHIVSVPSREYAKKSKPWMITDL